MDQNVVGIALGVSGGLFSVGFLVLAIAEHREAQIEARLQELPKSPLLAKTGSPRSGGGSDMSLPHGTQDRNSTRRRLGRSEMAPGPPATNPPARKMSLRSVANLACLAIPVVCGLAVSEFGLCSRNIGLLCGSLAGLAGFGIPSAWIRHKTEAYKSRLRRALPDFLDLMIVCLEAGLSVPGALVRVSEEIRIAHPRLGTELRLVQRDIDLGATIDAAFRSFAQRSGLEEVRTLSSFIREAQRFGSQLGDALRTHADMLRYQREQAAEENAQKASIKMLFPTLLLILPAVFVVLVGPAAIQIQEAFSK